MAKVKNNFSNKQKTTPLPLFSIAKNKLQSKSSFVVGYRSSQTLLVPKNIPTESPRRLGIFPILPTSMPINIPLPPRNILMLGKIGVSRCPKVSSCPIRKISPQLLPFYRRLRYFFQLKRPRSSRLL